MALLVGRPLRNFELPRPKLYRQRVALPISQNRSLRLAGRCDSPKVTQKRRLSLQARLPPSSLDRAGSNLGAPSPVPVLTTPRSWPREGFWPGSPIGRWGSPFLKGGTASRGLDRQLLGSHQARVGKGVQKATSPAGGGPHRWWTWTIPQEPCLGLLPPAIEGSCPEATVVLRMLRNPMMSGYKGGVSLGEKVW